MPRSNIVESEITTTSAARSSLLMAHEVVQVDAADFLFAFDEELDVDRQAAVLLQMRLDRLDVHEHLPLSSAAPRA